MLITVGDATHFLKIVTGTKNRPIGGKNNAPDIGVLGNVVKGILKGGHHRR